MGRCLHYALPAAESDIKPHASPANRGSYRRRLVRTASPNATFVRGELLVSVELDLPRLATGRIFLFKLHSPNNFIVGGGVFTHANSMPCSLAWEAFKEANGALSLKEMRARIAKYRRTKVDDREDFLIGCRILTQPFFLDPAQWIQVPESFALNTVTFKGYSTDDPDGRRLWDAVQPALAGVFVHPSGFDAREQTPYSPPGAARYGEPVLVKPRLGQGAFRVLVTDNYRRRCAVSGERTLPALDAAHIRPFAEGGEHDVSNGVLMRRDIHSLFDLGYVTISLT